jgi:hypothetical protein
MNKESCKGEFDKGKLKEQELKQFSLVVTGQTVLIKNCR